MEERGSPVHLETVHHCASARLVVACPVNYYLLPVPHKYFTLDQANRTLPLVRRIVADITALYPAWRDLVYRYELASAQARPEQGESPEQLAVRAEIDGVARRINGYLQVAVDAARSEEHTSELQSRLHLVCRLLLEKKKKQQEDTCAMYSLS